MAVRKWQDEVTRAFAKASGPVAHCGRISNIRNTLLLFFLMEVKGSLKSAQETSSNDPGQFLHTVTRAITSVRDCPCRIYNQGDFLTLSNVGPALAKIVQSVLWETYPPDEADVGEEAGWRHFEASQKLSKAKSAAESKHRMASSKQKTSTATAVLESRPLPPEPSPPPAKRTRNVKSREYLPKKGSANYAFLICMFKGEKVGKAHFGKDELMQIAEMSGLADKSIHGSGSAGAAAFNNSPSQMYNGWSSFKNLVNRDVPLVQKWSNPVKVKLTPEGTQLAARLYARAVEMGDVDDSLEDVDVDAILAGEGQAATAGAAAANARTEAARAAAGRVSAPREKRTRISKATTSASAFPDISPAASDDRSAKHSSPERATTTAASLLDSPITRAHGSGHDDVCVLMSDDDEDEPVAHATRPDPVIHRSRADQQYPRTNSSHIKRVPGSFASHDLSPVERATERAKQDRDNMLNLMSKVRKRRKLKALNASLSPRKPGGKVSISPTLPHASGRRDPHAASTSQRPSTGIVIQLSDSDDEPTPGTTEPIEYVARSAPDSSSQSIRLPALPTRHVPATLEHRSVSAPAGSTVIPVNARVADIDSLAASQSTSEAPSSVLPGAAPRAKVAWKLQLLTLESLTESRGLAHVRTPPLPPSCRFADVYETIVLLDNREQFSLTPGIRRVDRAEALQAHIDNLRAAGLTVVTRSLPVGDIAWIARCKTEVPSGPAIGEEYMLDWIAERKTAHDLISSIKDGRYERQKIQIARCGLCRPIYLLEGSLDELPSGAKAAKTASIQTEIWAGFTVLRTGGVRETKKLYVRMASHIAGLFGKLKPGHMHNSPLGPLPTYAEFVTRTQEEKKTTVRDMWTCMLCTVPGVGVETAEGIAKVYPVPISLFRALQACYLEATAARADTEKACIKVLAEIPMSLARTVGNRTATILYKDLFQTGWHSVDASGA